VHTIPPFLSAALRFQDPDLAQLRLASPAEWKSALSNWQAVRILLSAYHDRPSAFPDEVRIQLDSHLRDSAERFVRIKTAYARVASELRAAGAEHVVLKGISLFPGYADHPRFRPQGDVDLYCPPESVTRARDVLLSLGFRQKREHELLMADHLCTFVPGTGWRPSGRLCDPNMPICFEVHVCWWNEESTRLSAASVEDFWARRTARALDDWSFPGLDPVDNLGYTALNIVRDLLLSQAGADQVYGLSRFLHTQSSDQSFWRRWRGLHHDSVRQLQAISFRMARDSFHCNLPEEVQEELNRLPPRVRGWFDVFARSGLNLDFAHLKDGVWLHLALLSGLREKSRVLARSWITRPRGFSSFSPEPTETITPEPRPRRSLVSHGAALASQTLKFGAWFVSRAAVRLSRLPPFLYSGARYQLAATGLSRPFWIFLAASFFFDVGLFIFFFLYNLFLLDRGFDEKFLGVMASVMNIGGIVCTLPAGLVINRLGLRKALFICFLGVPLVAASRAFSLSQTVLLGLAFLSGFITTIWAVVLSPAITRLTTEKNRSVAFSIECASGIGIGIIANLIASRIPGWLIRLQVASNSTDAKQRALILGCAIVALGILPISRLRFPPVCETSPRLYPRNRFLLRFLPAVAVWSLITGSLAPLANVYFAHHLKMPLEQLGVVLSTSSLLQVLAVLAAPLFFRRFGLVTAMAAAQVLIALLLAALAGASAAAPASILYIAYTGLLWMSEPGLFALLMSRVSPAEQAGASALNFLVISIFQAVAVASAGASFVRFGYPRSLLAMAILALASSFLFRRLLGLAPSTAEDSKSVTLSSHEPAT
jgi:predicted MFS family arabinose efflux permease